MYYNKKKLLTYLLAFLVTILFAIHYLFLRGNTNALWEVVSQQCVPNQIHHNNPAPCLKVDLDKKYVTFKDAKGPVHDLVMPAYKITGIESPDLQLDGVPPFIAYAWEERGHLSEKAGKKIEDKYISLAVNSKYGRSQDQLHIHMSCLKPDIFQQIDKNKDLITYHWEKLPFDIAGHEYIARKLSGIDLQKEDPFKLLNKYALSINDKPGNYGLAVIKLNKDTVILLAVRIKIWKLITGSAGEIQDYNCSLAQ